MKISSEYVTLGHSDRLCDAIASNLINRIQQNDSVNSHAAVEVFASDNKIIFGGEVKTSIEINKQYLSKVVEESFNDCGYTISKRNSFSKKEVYLAKDSKIVNTIHTQSSDIAMATTDRREYSGFNDQGIFFGAYDSATPTGQGIAKYLAQSFGDYLFNMSLGHSYIGSDIKVVFTLDFEKDGYTPKKIEHITVAIPLKAGIEIEKLKLDSGLTELYLAKHPEETSLTTEESVVINAFYKWTYKLSCELKESFPEIRNLFAEHNSPTFSVNGTGRYVNHGYHFDASMTGRKLVVNNMSAGPIWGQNQCGGGSYIKPFHASDFLLPMVCNWISKIVVDCGFTPYAYTSISCTIGSSNIDSLAIYGSPEFNKKSKLVEALIEFFSKLDLSPYGMGRRWKYPENLDFYKAVKLNFVTTKDGPYLPWYDTSFISGFLMDSLKEKKVISNEKN